MRQPLLSDRDIHKELDRLSVGERDVSIIREIIPGKGTRCFASSEIAEQLAGSVAGTILPFSFTPELELIADPALLEYDELYFNAARLDRSLVLKTSDYMTLAKPRLERIAEAQQ